MRISSSTPPIRLKPAPINTGSFGRPTLAVDKVFKWLGANRTREMLVEDFVGFGALRTVVDSLRGFFYGTGTFNFLVGAERLAREASSIFTDNILSGLAAWGLGKWQDGKRGAYSNGWTDFPTMELFRELADKSANEKAFLENLAEKLAAGETPALNQFGISGGQATDSVSPKAKQAYLETLKAVWGNTAMDGKTRTSTAAELMKRLGRESFDLKLDKESFQLDNLLDDLGLFRNQMGKLTAGKADASWQNLAQKTLRQTMKVKNWKMACIGLGLAATFGAPFLIARLTEKLAGFKYYPGDIGLKGQIPDRQKTKPKPAPALFARNQVFQGFLNARPTGTGGEERPNYVFDSLKKGSKWPFLISLVPLFPALGLFDTVNRSIRNPFKRGFMKALRNALDFSKSAPFTTQPQMASMFALLITARLWGSRSDNEFRERLLDSGLGWAAWILATPVIKRVVAGILDRHSGTKLLKKVDDQWVLRTRDEIEHLLPSMKGVTKEIAEKTLKRHIWIGATSTMITMAILGILTPLLGIYWSRHNSQRKQAALQAGQPPAFPTQPQPFTPTQSTYFRQT